MTQVSRPTKTGWWHLLLAAVAAALVALLGAGTASATTAHVVETCVGASPVAAQVIVGVHESVSAGRRWGHAPPRAVTASATGVAANGGAAALRVGQAGEAAVRSLYDIGPKATAQISGRTRIFDGLNDVAVSEIKKVMYQAYTQQLKDSLAYAQQNGLGFDLDVRGGAAPTTLSRPLEEAIRNGDIGLRSIP